MKRKFLFRIISVIELIFMIFTIAPVISFAQEEMPQDLTAVYEDDFSDGEISPNIDTYRFYTGDPADTLIENDNKLTFRREKWLWYTDSNAGEPSVRLYPNSDRTSLGGKVFVRFNLEKTREVVRVRFCDDLGKYLTQISWEGDKLSFDWRDSSLASRSKTLDISADTTINIAMCADYDTTGPRFSLWINDELQISNGVSKNDVSSSGLNMIQVYTLLYSSYSKAGTFSISDFGVYTVNDSSSLPEINYEYEAIVDADISGLTADKLINVPLSEGFLIDPLNIGNIKSGTNGSEISWQSSDEEVITNQGEIIRPDDDTEVTLTATVKYADVSKEKTFTFKVPGKNHNTSGIPGNKIPVMYDDFSDGTIGENIVKSRFYTDNPEDTLTEENGKLTFERTKYVWYTDSNCGEPQIRFYMDSENTPFSGKTLIEFTLSKTREVVRVRLCDKDHNYLTQIFWEGNSFKTSYRDDDFIQASKTLQIDSDETVKVSIYTDLSEANPKFSMWINNEKQLDSVISATTLTDSNLIWMQFYTLIYGNYSKAGSYSLDNVGIYSVDESFIDDSQIAPPDDGRTNEERVDDDLELLTEDTILSVPKTEDGYVLDPLEIGNLSYGESGSLISWTSSHEDIIDKNGALVRPESDTFVTLTAALSFADVTKSKSFTLKVPGTSTDIDGMRTDTFPWYYDDFSDGELNERITPRNIKNTDMVDEKDGKLTLRTTAWASHEPGIMFYKDSKQTEINGDFITQFTISKTCDIVRIRTNNRQWNYLNQIYWNKNDFLISYRDSDMNTKSLKLDISPEEKVKVTIYTNITGASPKFTMWINNKMVLEDVYSCTDMSPASVQWLQIYTLNYGDYGKTGKVIIDNVGYYDILPEMTDSERVKADYDILTDESLIKTTTPLSGYAFEELNLPEYGINGSRITWHSSNEDVVSTDGTVTRDENENIPVTLTATITYKGAKKIKEFELIILGNHVDTTDVPTVEDMIVENDFESSDTPSLINSNLAGGGEVKVEDGVVKLIKTGSGTSSVGVMIYTGLDETTSATGVIGLEYDIKREKASPIQIRSMDSNGNLYYSAVWGDGGMSAYYSNDKSTQGVQNGVWSGSGNSIHVNMLFDTNNSTYWLWVNGEPAVVEKYSRNVGVGSVCYTMFYLETVNSVEIDNYKVYHAIPPKALRLKFDSAMFGEENILNETPHAGNIIKSSLNLPKTLRYGTKVEWVSSDPDIINPDTGEVIRPDGGSVNPTVTLTAFMENSGITSKREYTYSVLRTLPDGADIEKEEVNDIGYDQLTKESPDEIYTSLNLMDFGIYGSRIKWKSSDTTVITNSGRVIRPRFTDSDKTVTLTAQIGEYKKEFTFTVKADETPKDPMHTSDEEFFGVYNGSRFIKGPQLDYSNPELSGIEECAKAGDYEGAKQALYEYFKARNVPSPIALGTRRSGWVDARADGVFEMGEEASYWKGQMTINSDDYELYSASIYNPSAISKIECKTFELLARYNESTSAFVLGTDVENTNMVPRLELTVNGSVRSYKATGSATIRAGKFSREHIDNNKELQAKMFGDFLGDETYRILLSFDLSELSSTDVISAAKLTLYAKKSSPSAESKQLWIMDNRSKAWDEKSVYWDSLNFAVHNYNGLVGGSDWKGARSSDIEFSYQMPRFMHARNTMTEYKYTGNEKYAYSLLTQVLDLITDAGHLTPYPRSLDAALRMHQLVPLMNTFKDSPYMTAEFCTAFMKYMYRQFEYFPTRKEATGNWRDYEQLAVLYATSAYPELANSANAKEICIWSWQNAFNKSYMPDGSYIEDTGGYHRSSFSMYRDFKKACVDSNTELPEEFDETLRKAAYYMVLTNSPSGLTLQYGDESGGSTGSNRYLEVADWYNDYEFRFVDSFGKSGVQPSWTSYQFPEGRYTMMRSGWNTNAIYLHTNVRGGGGHGHADDNSIILFANGKRLLVDAGKFTYNSYDPARMYGVSTEGHNTVVINDTSQRMSWTGDEYTVRGNINDWVSNSKYDFLSQTSVSYADHDHTRNILFIKDGLFVVSDLMEPHNKNTLNNYKQYWHMSPEANISADSDKNILASDYDDGKNLILVSADDTQVYLKDGYYDTSDGTAVANKAGVFEKSQVGDTVIDTVMYVTKRAGASVEVEKLSCSGSDVSALKIAVSENGKTSDYYYMHNRKYTGGENIGFGEFSTDAKVALVSYDSDGNISSCVVTDGTYVKRNNKYIVKIEEGVGDFYVEHKSSEIRVISSDENLRSENISIMNSGNVKTVKLNGQPLKFNKDSDNMISFTDEKAEENLKGDNNKNDGIAEKPSSGGGGGGGGGGGESSSDKSGQDVNKDDETSDKPADTDSLNTLKNFKDTENHWANESIMHLYSKGIVNGVGEGMFLPDSFVARGEFVAIAARTLGLEETEYAGTFEDVRPTDWFAPYVQMALDIGIISEDSNFRPYDSITREEIAKILVGCAIYLGKDSQKGISSQFADEDSISLWAKNYVEKAVSMGLMNGKGDNFFSPLDNATRAETATVFSRLILK